MKLDPEYLRQHYSMLSDEALMEIDRTDLVDMARTIYDLEVAGRQLAPSREVRPDALDEQADDEEPEFDGEPLGEEEEPAWLDDASEVYSHAIQSRSAESPDAVLNARDAIETAGIPCYLELCEIPPEKSLLPYGTHRWRVMVPGKMNMLAMSALEREIHNPEFEAGWKTYLETLSDEELRKASPKVALSGLFDRIARANKVYDAEVGRRKSKP
ncbi:MAG TPA: hypothetical protein VGH38_00310 [Bryobacteraceae bacterium]|jgi:hypothetical protein